jgi:tRNA A37 threonylcarbamoyladenosine synthetase subunit TsaC/SUA5/YrdC
MRHPHRELRRSVPRPEGIIVPKRPSVPETITQLPSVGMTCPDEKAWVLVNLANFPIVCSSANKAEGKAAIDVVGAEIRYRGRPHHRRRRERAGCSRY